jgi:hypothetical protein
MIKEAIDFYHGWLNDTTAAETNDHLTRLLHDRNLFFGSRPLCTVLRPYFYPAQQWDYLVQETEMLLGAFARAHEACLHSADLREQLALEAYEEQLFSLDIGGVIPWTTSRLDSFFAMENDLHYVEYNAETPAGMGYEHRLAEAFLELEPMKRMMERYQIRQMPMLDELYDALVRAYHDWGGVGAPNIVIADWQDVPTLTEHEICRAHFTKRGSKTQLADPRALDLANGKLYHGDMEVHLIYKRVLISEMIQRMGLDNPIVRAVKAKAVLMTNSFSAKLMAKKASFAFLSDERNTHLFTPEQHRAIANHIPWTRNVSDRKTMYNGQMIDLLPYISDHRAEFVLKPNDEYGGKGVVMGLEATDEQWAEGLRAAQTTPYVVQHRVNTATREFPALIDGKLHIGPRFVDADPYVFYGQRVHGILTRLSSATLLNVTAGTGSVVPTFIIDGAK